MKIVARIEQFFELGHHSVITMRFLSDDARIRVNEKIQLRTPDGQVMDTQVEAIEHIKYSLLGPPADPHIIGITLPREITRKDVPAGTEVWNFRD